MTSFDIHSIIARGLAVALAARDTLDPSDTTSPAPATASLAPAALTTPSASAPLACEEGNSYNGMLGLRISAIFVIFVAGSFGALFPIISSKSSKVRMPATLFFIAKYFGSGVIVATSLIHLLQPASEYLSNPCLGEGWQEYPYAFGIALTSLFATFLVEILSRRYLAKRGMGHSHGPAGLAGGEIDLGGVEHGHAHGAASAGHVHTHSDNRNNSRLEAGKELSDPEYATMSTASLAPSSSEFTTTTTTSGDSHAMAMQLGSIFMLEFGIIFHSVFVGLSLAVSDNIKTLYIVLVFHQMFEGFGLGTRIAAAPWPSHKRWLPWALGIAFGVTTPIAICIGLGVRTSYPPGSHRALITNGVFDSISAGILLYAGLVELMGSEFLHSEEFERASTGRVLAAYGIMCGGAGFMALLGRWV